MKIEIDLSQEVIERIVALVAEELSKHPESHPKGNTFDNMTILEVIGKDYAVVSNRLCAILLKEFPGWTMKELAGIVWRDYKRVRGMGAKTYNELCLFFEKLNYKPGWNRLMYDRKTNSYVIFKR